MIYFDSAASTCPKKEVLDVFLSASQDEYANPSSTHAYGRSGGRLLESARKQTLDLFGVSATHQAIFLSGATEANNLALKGIAFNYQNRGKKILVSAVEHPSVLEPARYLAKAFGFEVVELPVDSYGRVSPETLQAHMDKDVILVSIMGVNNETGTINDLKALSQITHRYPKCFFHSDLTQAIGKVEIDFSCLDLFSFSGHKIHGLKGVGALIYKKNIRFVPVLHGGGQEFGYRSSTVALPLALSLSKALELSLASAKNNLAHVKSLRETLLQGLENEEIRVNSPLDEAGSPYVLSLSLLRHKASVIMEGLSEEGIYVSTSSACSASLEKPSYVLLSMGLDEDSAKNAIRVSFSEGNTLDEVRLFLASFHRLLKEIHAR